MRIKIAGIFIGILLLMIAGLKPVFALEHSQRDGLFSMDVITGWHWFEYPDEIVITYPDGKTAAIDIQFVHSPITSLADIKKTLKAANDRMVKQGVEAHQGKVIDEKEFKIDGVFATQLDFKTAPPNPVYVTYISFFNKGYAFTVTYGSVDDKIRSVMDDAFATLKFR